MHTPRNGLRHQKHFVMSTNRLATERLQMERDGILHHSVDNLAVDTYALCLASVSKHGGMTKGKLEEIAIAAMDRADLVNPGEYVLQNEVYIDRIEI